MNLTQPAVNKQVKTALSTKIIVFELFHLSWKLNETRGPIQYAHAFRPDSRRKKWSDDADSTKPGQVAMKSPHPYENELKNVERGPR
jgi:hypothetical protein